MGVGTANSNGTLTRQEELRLIRAFKRGQRDAIRELIDHHKQRLFAFVWRVLPNQQDAEDVCQEAFLKAISSIHTFDPTYRFSTWLFTIAYRLSLNCLRKRRRMSGGEIDFTTFADGSDECSSTLAESEEARRLKDAVWNAVEELSNTQRTAITLFYRESHTCQEIAEVMDVPVATVKSHLHRARARLRELLEPMFGGQWQKLTMLTEAVA